MLIKSITAKQISQRINVFKSGPLHQPAMIGLPELEGGQRSRLQQIRAQLQSFSEFILI